MVELFLTSPFKTYLACSWPGQQMYVNLLNSSDGRSDSENFLNRIPGESEICKFAMDKAEPLLMRLQDAAFNIWLFHPPVLC